MGLPFWIRNLIGKVGQHTPKYAKLNIMKNIYLNGWINHVDGIIFFAIIMSPLRGWHR